MPAVHLQDAEELVSGGQVEGVGGGVIVHPECDADGGHDGVVSAQAEQHSAIAGTMARPGTAHSRQCFVQSAHVHTQSQTQ